MPSHCSYQPVLRTYCLPACLPTDVKPRTWSFFLGLSNPRFAELPVSSTLPSSTPLLFSTQSPVLLPHLQDTLPLRLPAVLEDSGSI